MNREEAETFAREAGRKLVADARKRNEEWARETGSPSTVSDADYAKAEAELVASMLKLWRATHREA